jgi:hypothetical protein
MSDKWYKLLIDQIHQWPESAALKPEKLFEIELGLFLLEELGQLPLNALPMILKGHAPASYGEQRRMITAARCHIGRYSREPLWHEDAQAYMQIPEAWRGYRFAVAQFDNLPTKCKPTICAERYQIYRDVLQSPPPPQEAKVKQATQAGRYAFDIRSNGSKRTCHVVIPPQVLKHVPALESHYIPRRAKREPLCLSLDELRQTARWMDKQEKGVIEYQRGNWASRLNAERLQLQVFQAGDQLCLSDVLEINGMFHLVGMVSSGKSALMEVIAVHLARQAKRVTLVVGDVMTALDKARQFNGLCSGWAAPVLGRDTYTHIARLQSAVANETDGKLWTSRHSGFRFVSLACPLMAFRDRGEPDEWLKPKDYPCRSLYQEKNNSHQRYACPLFTACPYQQAQRDLVNAPIWIATPESLIYSSASSLLAPPDFPGDDPLYFARLAYHRSDLIIIDEVDSIQKRLDDIFSQSADLQAWFINIKRSNDVPSVERKFDLAPEHVLLNNDVSEMSRRLPQLFELIKNPALKKYRRTYFSDVTLFDQLAHDLSKDDEEVYRYLWSIFDKFIDDPRRGDDDHVRELGQIAAWSGKGSQKDVEWERGELRAWLKKNVPLSVWETFEKTEIASLIERLRFALIVTATQDIFNRLRYYSDETVDTAPFIVTPPYYRNVVPSAPMGNILAFLHDEGLKGRDEPATLKVVDCRGLGRWVLLNLHRIFESEGAEGPHILAMSGTSWAGESPDCDFQHPVNGVLAAHDKEIDAIRESEFRFQYIPNMEKGGEPFFISGISDPEERQSVLVKMVKRMAQPGELLENELNKLPPERRRAVLFTGNYKETIPIYEALTSLDRWKPLHGQDRVLRLVRDEDPDDSPGTIRRGRVHTFANTAAEILIAPLGAIERGHNILNASKKAALGLAVFLVRIHPSPDDLGYALHTMNRWAVKKLQAHELSGIPVAVADKKQFETSARALWRRLLVMPMIYSHLSDDDHRALTWTLLVTMYQVIGRLVRGGVPAKVIFCDAKFLPKLALEHKLDDEKSSLLYGLRYILRPYLDDGPVIVPARDREVAKALYGAMYPAIQKLLDTLPRPVSQ